MCILRFHARAGYLQHYETLLKEVELHHPAPIHADQPEQGPVDQYAVELCTLADRNHNVPCESGIRYPSLVAMQNRPLMTSRISVMYIHKYVHTAPDIVCTSMY